MGGVYIMVGGEWVVFTLPAVCMLRSHQEHPSHTEAGDKSPVSTVNHSLAQQPFIDPATIH